MIIDLFEEKNLDLVVECLMQLKKLVYLAKPQEHYSNGKSADHTPSKFYRTSPRHTPTKSTPLSKTTRTPSKTTPKHSPTRALSPTLVRSPQRYTRGSKSAFWNRLKINMKELIVVPMLYSIVLGVGLKAGHWAFGRTFARTVAFVSTS